MRLMLRRRNRATPVNRMCIPVHSDRKIKRANFRTAIYRCTLLINREHNFFISISISLRRRLDNDNNRCDYSSAKLTGISRNGTVQGVRNQNGESVDIYYCWYHGP